MVQACFLASMLMTPCISRALGFAAKVELLYGHDDNINQKEDRRKTQSAFLSVVPGVSLSGQPVSDVIAEAGYEFTYTEFLAEGLEKRLLHRAWGGFTHRLRPGLFLDLTGSMESLKNNESPDDNRWGLSLAPALTYHVSDRLSTRVTGIYSRWRYDSLDFDSGRAIIRLDSHQVDDRYAGEGGIIYLVTPSTSLDLAYRITYNDSSNAIDEYTAQTLRASIRSALGDKVKIGLGYSFGRWNYFNWRAGKNLRGKLRDDSQQFLRLDLDYAIAPYSDLVFSAGMTANDSNLQYESFDRRLVYAGLRMHW